MIVTYVFPEVFSSISIQVCHVILNCHQKQVNNRMPGGIIDHEFISAISAEVYFIISVVPRGFVDSLGGTK